jgi:hypothetical protein
MTVVPVHPVVVDQLRLSGSLRLRNPETRCTLVVSEPSAEPRLWRRYLAGALRSYRKHGVEHVLDIDAIRDGQDTTLFYTVLNDTADVLGGVRAKGPYRHADESHAVAEWEGQPAQRAVRKMISDRLPFGVVEMKSAWVADDGNRSVAKLLARTALPTMVLLDVQFVMATAATHVLDRWLSSGGVVASKIPAAPYPDRRYQTRMMWWDRRTFLDHAEPEQASKIVAETVSLTMGRSKANGIAAAAGASS